MRDFPNLIACLVFRCISGQHSSRWPRRRGSLGCGLEGQPHPRSRSRRPRERAVQLDDVGVAAQRRAQPHRDASRGLLLRSLRHRTPRNGRQRDPASDPRKNSGRASQLRQQRVLQQQRLGLPRRAGRPQRIRLLLELAGAASALDDGARRRALRFGDRSGTCSERRRTRPAARSAHQPGRWRALTGGCCCCGERRKTFFLNFNFFVNIPYTTRFN